VTGPGGLLGLTIEDSMLKRLGGGQAARAGDGGIVVPRGVGAEVTLPSSHLVKATRGKLVEAHERVGL